MYTNTKPALTEEVLERAVRAFHAQHGKAPRAKSGIASPYFGWTETWRSIEECLRLGLRGLAHMKGSSLSKYTEGLGLKTPKPDRTVEALERAVRAYHAQHGKAPTAKTDSDASPYFGWPETWANINQCIRNGYRGFEHMKGSSLVQYVEGLGLKIKIIKPDFTSANLERAVRSFYAKKGKAPTRHSGDASPYFGWEETWRRVDNCIREGNRGLSHLKEASLSQYVEGLKLRPPKLIKPDFTEEGLERAVRAYHAKEGKIPNDRSGDASPYFGWPETWANVNQCIDRGGRGLSHLKESSLPQYARRLGLKTPGPTQVRVL